jgi:hypothetical protein
MNYSVFIVKTIVAFLTLVMAACNMQSTPEPTAIPTETPTPIPPTATPTLSPTPEPTSTPTVMPTLIGGRSGHLLFQVACPVYDQFVQSIFLYNLVSHELDPFLEGYTALDVSSDGKKILLKANQWETGNLYLVDIAQPEQMKLLHENVDDVAWLGDSDWIGFISKANGIRQVFVVHSDGSGLTQVTNSSVGAVFLMPLFDDGVYWGEGTIGNNGLTRTIREYKFTKLDGTETEVSNIRETLPLSEDKFLVEKHATSATDHPQFWVTSRNGKILAELPLGYRPADQTDPPSPYRLLSPDGVWMLVYKVEKLSDGQFMATYHLFDTTTSEIQDLPNLSYSSKTPTGRCRVNKYFWIDFP